MNKLFIPAMLGSIVFLASCSSKDELVFCPPLSAPVEGARAFVLTDEQKQTVDVRLNGVRARCTAEADGSILMEVKAGLKMTRDLAQNAAPRKICANTGVTSQAFAQERRLLIISTRS